MPEDVTSKLTQFTPTLPDRDALLFAAGRASARPAPIWKVLCGLLAISQVAMAVVWLTRPTPSVSVPTTSEGDGGEASPTPFTPDPYSYIALSKSTDLDLPRPRVGPVETGRHAPPLKAGWRGELPN